MPYEEYYQQLNKEQRHAVNTINGPMMVMAGPGTGKTQLLSVRTANILRQSDLYPSNILVVTFTNTGAKAMRERLASIMGPNGYEVVVETFHSLANTMITESEEAALVRGERIEMTELERIYLLEYLLDHLPEMWPIRSPNAPYLSRRDIESSMSILKRDGISPENLENFLKTLKTNGKSFEEKHLRRLRAFTTVYKNYEEAKTPEGNLPVFDKRGRYDFDDMIGLATELLSRDPDLLSRYQEQFQYAMVDEFQDTNGAQLKLLLTLFKDKDSNVCVVGDDDQSIFRFQGASTENFRIFQEYFLKTEKINLVQHFRSKPGIIRTATRAIRSLNPASRFADKNLHPARSGEAVLESLIFGTEEEELTFLMDEFRKIPHEQRKNIALLCRTRKQVGTLIDACLQAGIPYATDGKEDIRAETRVQQLIKILKLADKVMDLEEKDVMLFEILLFDFFEIDHRDLMSLTLKVNQERSVSQKKARRTLKKTLRMHQQEEVQETLTFNTEKAQPSSSSSLLTKLLFRFPLPPRISIKKDNPPTPEETASLSIIKELSLIRPNALHKASWVLQRLIANAAEAPVYPVVMNFLQDSGLTDYILRSFEKNQVVRLRDLRCISAFVENLKKASHADPTITLHHYLSDIEGLERHEIPLSGTMVSSHQEGVRILTAHGAKGLEFDTVFIPFCIDKKSWPKRSRRNSIPIPKEILIGQKHLNDEHEEKILHEEDEMRLFYVAISRAKNRLVFTAAPEGKEIISEFLERLDLAPTKRTIIPEEKVYIRMLTKTPLPDPVRETKETFHGLLETLSLSPSSMNRYLTCPRQFLYHHLLKTPQPKKTALVYGQCVHKALEKTYRRFLKEGKIPEVQYFEEVFLEELHFQGVEKSVSQSGIQKFEHAKRWYEEELNSGPIPPLELERRLVRKMPDGLIFEGKFDKVERMLGESGVNVVDYKTGEPDKHIRALYNIPDIFSPDCDDYLRQLIAYKMLYESGYHRLRVNTGELVFLDPAKKDIKKYGLKKDVFVRYKIPLTMEMVRNYEALVLQTWRKIKALEFDRLSAYEEKKCGYCPYKNVCWK